MAAQPQSQAALQLEQEQVDEQPPVPGRGLDNGAVENYENDENGSMESAENGGGTVQNTVLSDSLNEAERPLDGSPGTQQDGSASGAPQEDSVGLADEEVEEGDVSEAESPSRSPRGTAATLSTGSPRLRRTLSGSVPGVHPRETTGVVAKSEFNGKISVGEDYQCEIPADHVPDNAEEVTRVGTTRWCPVQADASVVSSCMATTTDAVDGGGDGGVTNSVDRQHPVETGCDVAIYLKAAKKAQPSVQTDELLSALHDHQYDTTRTLDTLQSQTRARACSKQGDEGSPTSMITAPQHVLDAQSLDSWSEDDKLEFADAISKYGKDFSKINRRIPSRTVPQLILYYYLRWKGTPQFFEWQEQSFNKTNDDECAAPHCPWGSTDPDGDGGGGGGGGGLLCCDGCPKAFHFSCCQPKPLSVLNLVGRKWYCAKCTASRRRWGREPIPCSGNPERHDCSPCGGRGEIRLLNDTKMLLPTPVMQYKSLSCNPRCKHCINLLSGSGRAGVAGGGDSRSNNGRRRSGRQAAVAEVNVFRGAGLNVREPVIATNTAPNSDGTDTESDNGGGGAGRPSDSASDEPRIRGRSDEMLTDDGRSSDSAEDKDKDKDKDNDEEDSDREGSRKRQRLRQSSEN